MDLEDIANLLECIHESFNRSSQTNYEKLSEAAELLEAKALELRNEANGFLTRY